MAESKIEHEPFKWFTSSLEQTRGTSDHVLLRVVCLDNVSSVDVPSVSSPNDGKQHFKTLWEHWP